uniref:Ig-like domain-containing protein n=1 Tax=Loa loa TaxID=7209 RepID=A0A1I7W446_LOALO
MLESEVLPCPMISICLGNDMTDVGYSKWKQIRWKQKPGVIAFCGRGHRAGEGTAEDEATICEYTARPATGFSWAGCSNGDAIATAEFGSELLFYNVWVLLLQCTNVQWWILQL